MHAAIHPLTPGSPAYALIKVSAVGGLIAWRVAAARGKRDTGKPQTPDGAEPTHDVENATHPVSRRKAQRRRRR